MTQKEYGTAYSDGCGRTVRFLLSRGLSEDDARETAQAAWVRGWERRDQIRDNNKTLTWVNSIALNLYRSRLRRDRREEALKDFPIPPLVNIISIDVHRMLARCRNPDRKLLEQRYLYGFEIAELARDQGCTRTAVRVKLLRARKSLRRLFERKHCCRFHSAATAPLQPIQPWRRKSWSRSAGRSHHRTVRIHSAS